MDERDKVRVEILNSKPDPTRPWQEMCKILLEAVTNSAYLLEVHKEEMAHMMLIQVREVAESLYTDAEKQ